jgi:hypothetical protein
VEKVARARIKDKDAVHKKEIKKTEEAKGKVMTTYSLFNWNINEKKLSIR